MSIIGCLSWWPSVLRVAGWHPYRDRRTEKETVETFTRHLEKAWNIDSASDTDTGASKGSSLLAPS